MTHSTQFNVPGPRGLGSGVAVLRAQSGWIIAFGAVLALLGILAFGSVFTATVITVYFVGISMVAGGIAEIVMGFQARSWSRFAMWLALGVIYTLAGGFALANPLLAAGVLTLVLGASLVVAGVLRIVLAFQMRAGSAWLWVALSGAITTALGWIVLSQWPFSSLYVLGLFLSIDLLIAGMGWITLGLALRRTDHPLS